MQPSYLRVYDQYDVLISFYGPSKKKTGNPALILNNVPHRLQMMGTDRRTF